MKERNLACDQFRHTWCLLTLVLLLAPFGLNAQVTGTDHVLNSSAPDANKYNLDMSLDSIPAGNFLYCRWGMLADQATAQLGLVPNLFFDYLTQPPYSQANKDLFIVNSSEATSKFLLSSFPNQWPLPSSSSWTGPSGASQTGQIGLISPQNGNTYYLFRKYHFSPALFEWQGPNLQPRLSQDAKHLVIMIHGWNRAQNSDFYFSFHNCLTMR